MKSKEFCFNGNGESTISLAVINVEIDGEKKEVIPAFTKFSIPRRNPPIFLRDVDRKKLLPTLFPFTEPAIFRAENHQLFDFNGTEIPKELDEKVLVYLDKADNLQLFEVLAEETLLAKIVKFDNISEAYRSVSLSFAYTQLPQKDGWMRLSSAVTTESVLSDITSFVEHHKVSGTTAQAYFSLKVKVTDLKKACTLGLSPLDGENTPRTKEQANKLYEAVQKTLTAKIANKTRIAREIDALTRHFENDVDKIVSALNNLDPKAIKKISKAKYDDQASLLNTTISTVIANANRLLDISEEAA